MHFSQSPSWSVVPEVTCFPSWGSTCSKPTFGSELYLIRNQHISRHQRAGAALAKRKESPGLSGDGHVSVKSPRLTEELDLPHRQWIHACTVRKFLSVGDFWFDSFSLQWGLRHHVSKTRIFLWCSLRQQMLRQPLVKWL